MHPDEDVTSGFYQFVTDNGDVNVCRIARVTGFSGTAILHAVSQIPIQTFERQFTSSRLQTIEVLTYDNIAPNISDILWMYE